MNAKPTSRTANRAATARNADRETPSGSRLRRALRAGSEQVKENPFAAVAGAAAVSAGLALLLPASRREAEVMGEVADKLAEAAREAAEGVVAAGQSQVETLAQAAIVNAAGAAVGAMITGDTNASDPSR